MRRYETIIIIDSDLPDEERKPLIQRLEDLIPQNDGLLVMVDEWGVRRLAYKIKKKSRGYYVRMDYCGTSALVNEMERFLRIDDRALKYMTVLTEKDADVESVKAEIAQAAAEAESKVQAAEAESKVQAAEAESKVQTTEAEPKVQEETPDAQADDQADDQDVQEDISDDTAGGDAESDETATEPQESETPETENKKEES